MSDTISARARRIRRDPRRVLYDNFNRPDGVVGVATDGVAWQNDAAPSLIIGNKLANAPDGSGSAFRQLNVKDFYIKYKVDVAGDYHGTFFRTGFTGSGFTDNVMVRSEAATAEIVVSRSLGGVVTDLYRVPWVFTPGDIWEVFVIGDTVTLEINNVQVFSLAGVVVMGNDTDQSFLGIYDADSKGRIDEIEVWQIL